MILHVIRPLRRAIGFIWILLFLLLVGFSLFTHIAPLTGRQLFIIVGGSMEPTIPIGSLVIVTKTDPMTIAVGEVVTIRADNGIVVTHRVTQVVDLQGSRSFQLQGDANQSSDGGMVPARAIVGAARQYVPYAGYAQDFLSKIPGFAAALALLGALFVAYMLLEMLEPPARAVPEPAPEPIGQ